jgi:hypothetical protein
VLGGPNGIDVERILIARDIGEGVNSRLIDRQPIRDVGSTGELLEGVHAAEVSLAGPGASTT